MFGLVFRSHSSRRSAAATQHCQPEKRKQNRPNDPNRDKRPSPRVQKTGPARGQAVLCRLRRVIAELDPFPLSDCDRRLEVAGVPPGQGVVLKANAKFLTRLQAETQRIQPRKLEPAARHDPIGLNPTGGFFLQSRSSADATRWTPAAANAAFVFSTVPGRPTARVRSSRTTASNPNFAAANAEKPTQKS